MNLRLGKTNETIDYLNELLVKYPNNLDIAIDLAINLNASGNIIEAIKLLETTSIPNKSARYYNSLAGLYMKNNQLNKARDTYKTLVELTPTEGGFWLAYSKVEERLGNIESALTITNQALKRVALKEPLLLQKANLLFNLKRNDAANKIVDDLFKQHPKNENILYLKAQLDLKQNEIQKTSAQFSKLYVKNPENEVALKWAQSEVKNGRTDEAIKVLETHEGIKGLNAASKAFLAELLIEKNAKKSKGLYLELNKTHPNNVAVLNNLALALNNLSEFEQSLIYAEQAFKVSKSSATLETYSVALTSNNQANKAVELITNSEHKALINDSLRLTLIEAYISMKQLDKAKEVFREFNAISDDLKPRYNKSYGQLD